LDSLVGFFVGFGSCGYHLLLFLLLFSFFLGGRADRGGQILLEINGLLKSQIKLKMTVEVASLLVFRSFVCSFGRLVV
jgi:hypothetical protein